MNHATHTTPLTIALIQQTCTAQPQQNKQHIEHAIIAAASQSVDIVLLPELHNTPYFCQTENPAHFDIAEPIPGPSTDQLAALAQQHQVVIVASLFEKRTAGLYHNTAVVFDNDGRIAGRYRKMHIPDDPGYYEKYYFTPGDLGFTPIQTRVGKLGVLICWDQWFPEAARLMTLAGADILLYPTAIGWDPNDNQEEQQRQYQAWLISQQAHAIANGITVAACNRVGFEADPAGQTAGIQFWGSSFVAGPQGQIIAQLNASDTNTLITTIDTAQHESVRRHWPFLRDRRIEAYGDLNQRFLDKPHKDRS